VSGQSKANSQQKRNNKRSNRSRRAGSNVSATATRPVVDVKDSGGPAPEASTQVVVARKPIWLACSVTILLGIVSVVGFVVAGGVGGVVVGIVFALAFVAGCVLTYMLANAEKFVAGLADKRASLETQLGRRSEGPKA
jgi:hypothetical protein